MFADQPRAIYWLSTLVSLMYLLRNRLKPIPRSEVAKSNTLVVFQGVCHMGTSRCVSVAHARVVERLRGLTSVFFSRVATLALADIKPLLVAAILEQNSLEDLAPGPSSPKNGPGELLMQCGCEHMRVCARVSAWLTRDCATRSSSGGPRWRQWWPARHGDGRAQQA